MLAAHAPSAPGAWRPWLRTINTGCGRVKHTQYASNIAKASHFWLFVLINFQGQCRASITLPSLLHKPSQPLLGPLRGLACRCRAVLACNQPEKGGCLSAYVQLWLIYTRRRANQDIDLGCKHCTEEHLTAVVVCNQLYTDIYHTKVLLSNQRVWACAPPEGLSARSARP